MPKWKKVVLQSLSTPAADHDDNPNLPWDPIETPSTHAVLRDMLLNMYWHCVRRDTVDILRSLVEWQTYFHTVLLPDEEDHHIHGFDTFVDQVSETSRKFAERLGACSLPKAVYPLLQSILKRPIHQSN